MPGISFIFDKNKHLQKKKEVISAAVDSLQHNKNYYFREVLSTDTLLLGESGYPGYPVECMEEGEFLILLEGKIYNKTIEQLLKELPELYRITIEKNKDYPGRLQKWTYENDGDYFLCIYNRKDGQVLFINDHLGRLPVYIHETENHLILSREIRFLISLNESVKLNPLAAAQAMLFGFPLGKNTQYSNINYFEPSSILLVDPSSASVINQRISRYNFDEIDTKADFNSIIDRLNGLFTDACRRRSIPGYSNVLSLSGGLDSRAVLGGLIKSGMQFDCLTYSDFEGSARADVEVAKQLAEITNSNWKLYNLPKTYPAGIEELIRLKCGLNYLGMSFVLPFYKSIRNDYGDKLLYFTGDGGDKVLPDLRLNNKINTLDALVRYLIENKTLFPISLICRLFKVSESDLISWIYEHLLDYPESGISNKFIHFSIYERARNWLFEGEDRYRFYFWNATPFYSSEFFRTAMSVSPNYKKNYSLFREFLSSFTPDLNSVNNAFWGFPLNSKKVYLYQLLQNTVFPKLPFLLKKKIKERALNSASINLWNSDHLGGILAEANLLDFYGEYIDIDLLREIRTVNTAQFWNLATLLHMLRELDPRDIPNLYGAKGECN